MFFPRMASRLVSFLAAAELLLADALRLFRDNSAAHEDCVPYSKAACQQAAEKGGLSLGGGGYAFAGKFSTKGCYTYKSGKYEGSAYFGTGGSLAARKKPRKGKKVEVEGADCSRDLHDTSLCATLLVRTRYL